VFSLEIVGNRPGQKCLFGPVMFYLALPVLHDRVGTT